ncbi:MAG: ABC transporter ATP-binding protein [Rhodospirillales bacterium]|nr:ABC transporter ATP-binding protein [Rhodospirillales bacterium]
MVRVETPAAALRGADRFRVAQAATLELRGVAKNFGGLRAVDGVSLTIEADEVLGIAGPNGAGKTTLFDVVTGLTKASEGDVVLDGSSIAGDSVHRRCQRGMARTFQQPTVAASLTVYENVALGCSFGQPRRHWAGVDDLKEFAEFVLELTGLADKAELVAGPLTVFDKKRLMLASAIATGPRVLLLDEPFGGLNPDEIDETLRLIRRVREFGVAIVCIEHVMRALVQLATRVAVMHHGAVFFEGAPQEMMQDERVISVYLGRSAAKPPARGGDGGAA